MEGLLKPVSTSYKTSQPLEEHLVEVVKPPNKVTPAAITTVLSSPESALEILRSEPDYNTVRKTLSYLVMRDAPSRSEFNIKSPSSKAAQIINAIVTEIVPNYWAIFEGISKTGKSQKTLASDFDKAMLLSCLRTVAGFNAILLRIKTLIQQSKESKKQDTGLSTGENLKILLDVLTALLEDEGDFVVLRVWHTVQDAEISTSQQKLMWAEFISMIGGGKVLAIAAEAVDIIKNSSKEIMKERWIINGTSYCSWLARNIVFMSKHLPTSRASAGWKNLSELLSKSFRLGHTGLEDYNTKYSSVLTSS